MNSKHTPPDSTSDPSDPKPLTGPRDYSLAEEIYDVEESYRHVHSNPPIPPGRFTAWILLGITAAMLIITAFFKDSPLSLRYALIVILLGSTFYLLFSQRRHENETKDGGNGAIV